jgi:hypothetical protein
MTFASKLILHSPVSDETLLDDFVEQCLRDGVSLLAVIGPGCTRLEDIIDEIVVGDGGDDSRFLCTTSHPDDNFDTVLNMAQTWEMERNDPVQEVRLQARLLSCPPGPKRTVGFPSLIGHSPFVQEAEVGPENGPARANDVCRQAGQSLRCRSTNRQCLRHSCLGLLEKPLAP